LGTAKAALDEGLVAIAEANLRLERMTVKSESDGIVMSRMVAPGSKLMLGMDNPHSAHVAHVYDPTQLQVRVDVPLADAASVGLGQEAIVIVDILPDIEFKGILTRIVHTADIGKNTIQVKVAITAPSPMIKPDMLARVKFLAKASAIPSSAARGSGLSVWIPRTAVAENGTSKMAWVLNASATHITSREIEIAREREDGWVEVTNGLNPGDALVAQPSADLVSGMRVRVIKGDL
jgi:RND family efflux transporter MFP subunit